MADAKKCDVCGTYYQNDKRMAHFPVNDLHPTQNGQTLTMNISVSPYSSSGEPLDLCKACRQEHGRKAIAQMLKQHFNQLVVSEADWKARLMDVSIAEQKNKRLEEQLREAKQQAKAAEEKAAQTKKHELVDLTKEGGKQ